MNSSSYWKGQLDYLQSNRPSSTNFYNADFEKRMNQAQNNINGLVSQQATAKTRMQEAGDNYNTFYGNMKEYGEVYKGAENEFGVTNAMDNYENSKKAVQMAQNAIDALPSSINANSNRVLTQAQRERANEVMSVGYYKNLNMAQNKSSMYEQAWKNARENQKLYTENIMTQQQNNLDNLSNLWQTEMDNYANIGKNLTSARTEYNTIQSDYRAWQNTQLQNELAVWEKQLKSAMTKYNSALSNEMAIADYMKNNKSYDFGNGYSIKNNGSGEAQYYKDGAKISAGEFLIGTSSNTNWDMWNTVWNDNVSTRGVGSDTVQTFKNMSALFGLRSRAQNLEYVRANFGWLA